MNTLDALNLMVRSFPGGREVVAMRIGKNDETLRKELSGKDPKFKLGESTANQIHEMCVAEQSPNCDAYATAVAASLGGYVKLEVTEEDGAKQDLREGVAQLMKETTDVLTRLTMALADEAISDNERKDIERELAEVIRKAQEIHRGVVARNEAGKPLLRVA